jgi:hypothetical protein
MAEYPYSVHRPSYDSWQRRSRLLPSTSDLLNGVRVPPGSAVKEASAVMEKKGDDGPSVAMSCQANDERGGCHFAVLRRPTVGRRIVDYPSPPIELHKIYMNHLVILRF